MTIFLLSAQDLVQPLLLRAHEPASSRRLDNSQTGLSVSESIISKRRESARTATARKYVELLQRWRDQIVEFGDSPN
jgi:hypothetical protein